MEVEKVIEAKLDKLRMYRNSLEVNKDRKCDVDAGIALNHIDEAIHTIRELQCERNHYRNLLPADGVEITGCNYQDRCKILKELQSKSEEVCEWEYVDTVSFHAKLSCNGKIRNIKSMRSYKYCPYCGRKIKVVE